MPHRHSLTELAAMLRAREISALELTEHFLARIEAADALNAFITVDADGARAQARAADAQLAGDAPPPLCGVPIVHKDIFCTRGVKTSSGSRMLDNFVAPYDATVVERLAAAGAVTLGKTNMDEFAMGSSNETSWYGAVRNPWSTDRVPGGSSGGSAAAVSARLAPAATGTDTGGSIRQPAALCGLTGLKPSYGRVSRYGIVAFASSLDQAGPLAQSAEDAAALFDAMAGFDPRDSTSLEHELAPTVSSLGDSLRGLKIGLPREFFDTGVDDEVASAVQAAVARLCERGASTVEVSLPNMAAGVPCYYVIAPAEASSNLARFDGVRYGYRCDDPADLADLYERSRAEGFGDEVKRRIMIGTYALSSGYYDAYYIKAQKIRRLIANDFEKAFAQCDVIAGPTTPTTAFELGEKTDNPVAMYLNDIYTITVNLAGLPGLSVPVGFDRVGLPVGMQLIGPYLGEARLLNVAHQYQMSTDFHRQIPGAFA